MTHVGHPQLLPAEPELAPALRAQIERDYLRFARDGLPSELEALIAADYGLDVSASYAGIPLRNPWGKASGQLSLNRAQVDEAAQAGLGFVVLKTVIAQDRAGHRTMAEWAVKESRMVVEPIQSRATGASGWTVTWNGRGWCETFDDYLTFVREARAIGRERQMLVVPSVKYHLPAPDETSWREEEYLATTRAILSAARGPDSREAVPLEKDFSPTLAGSSRAALRITVLDWLRAVPALIRAAAPAEVPLRVGLKLFNSLDDDEFQLAMLAEVHRSASPPDFLTYANRLFDPDRVFDGQRGVAYGGPDLSLRNLRLLSSLRAAQDRGQIARPSLPISATGDISSGRIAVEYLLRGCTSFQIHTLFQLPAGEYAMSRGTKVEKALHRLYFDPRDGFLAWALHAAAHLGVSHAGVVRLLDLARRGSESALSRRELDSVTA